jgi:peroxiredoxin
MWVKHNGMSKVIMISDQDGKFTLGFWTLLMKNG